MNVADGFVRIAALEYEKLKAALHMLCKRNAQYHRAQLGVDEGKVNFKLLSRQSRKPSLAQPMYINGCALRLRCTLGAK